MGSAAPWSEDGRSEAEFTLLTRGLFRGYMGGCQNYGFLGTLNIGAVL